MRKIYFTMMAVIMSAALWTSCSKKSSSTPAAASTTGISANSIYASGNVDGVPFSYVAGTHSIVEGVNTSSVGGHGNSYGQFEGWLMDTLAKTYLFRVAKGTLVTTEPAGDDDINTFFTPGTYPYSPPTKNDSLNGISITYYDAQHNEWATNNPPAKQDGSNFTITSKEIQRFGYYLKISATFNCKVYNTAGQSKTITDGKLTLFVH